MAIVSIRGLFASLRNAGLDTSSITSITFNADYSVNVTFLVRDEKGLVKVDPQTHTIVERHEEHAWKDPDRD